MINGVICSIFSAWILSWFGAADIVLEILQPLFRVPLTNTHYYAIAGIIGFIVGGISKNN